RELGGLVLFAVKVGLAAVEQAAEIGLALLILRQAARFGLALLLRLLRLGQSGQHVHVVGGELLRLAQRLERGIVLLRIVGRLTRCKELPDPLGLLLFVLLLFLGRLGLGDRLGLGRCDLAQAGEHGVGFEELAGLFVAGAGDSVLLLGVGFLCQLQGRDVQLLVSPGLGLGLLAQGLFRGELALQLEAGLV